MISSPYFWIAALLLSISLFGTGYHNGYNHANDHAEALKLQAVAKAVAKAKEQAKLDQKTAATYEAARETVRTIYIKVREQANENIKNNSDYDSCELDDVGLHLYNTNPRAATNPTGSPNGPMPGPTGSIGRQTIHNPDEQHRASADVLRLPGAP